MARTENLTIMFTDVVGYTERTSGQSRTQIRDLLKRCSRILLPIVHRYGGWQVKNLGDALLIAFRSPTDALRCGMAQHDAVAASNRGLPADQHLHIRVAVALGEVLVQDRDVFGEAVNLAARLENVTPADHLYFTEAVYLAMNKAEVPSQVVGTEQFKGIPEPVRIYQVPPRQVARLVPTGEPLVQPEPELPFGGAHLIPVEITLTSRLQGRWQELRLQASRVGADQTAPRARPTLRYALLVCAVAGAAAWGLRFWAPAIPVAAPPSNAAPEPQSAAVEAAQPALLAQAQPLLAAGRYEELQALYAPRLLKNPDDAEALLLEGHTRFHLNQRAQAVAVYARALQRNQRLQEDLLLARNLAAALSWAADEATPLILRYPTPALFEALAARVIEPGAPRGRRRAAELLDKLGQSERIDQAGWALQDLREASSCEARLAAVKRLHPLRDPRARKELEALTAGGLAGWWNNRCVRSEAAAALEALRSGPQRK